MQKRHSFWNEIAPYFTNPSLFMGKIQTPFFGKISKTQLHPLERDGSKGRGSNYAAYITIKST